MDMDITKVVFGGLGILYIVSPIDFIPEALLGPFGLVDDAAIAVVSVPLFLDGIGADGVKNEVVEE